MNWADLHDSAGCSMILYSTIERLIDHDIAVPGRCVVPMKLTTINLTSCLHEYASARDWTGRKLERGTSSRASDPFLARLTLDTRSHRPSKATSTGHTSSFLQISFLGQTLTSISYRESPVQRYTDDLACDSPESTDCPRFSTATSRQDEGIYEGGQPVSALSSPLGKLQIFAES